MSWAVFWSILATVPFQSQFHVLVLLWQDLRYIWKHCQTSPADIYQVGHPPVSLICASAASSAVWLPFIFRHNMHTGRWLSKISAVWDPKQEDCFVAGSMLRPRRLQVFHESGREQHTFTDQDNFNTVLPVTAFHPTRNALLGGNASGRLHVFTDWGLWLLSAVRDENGELIRVYVYGRKVVFSLIKCFYSWVAVMCSLALSFLYSYICFKKSVLLVLHSLVYKISIWITSPVFGKVLVMLWDYRNLVHFFFACVSWTKFNKHAYFIPNKAFGF